MSFCIICYLRSRILRTARRTGIEQQYHFSSDLISELEELCVEYTQLTTLLAVLAASGSKTVLPVVLALLIYTISLRLTNACFPQSYPTLSRFLHTVPLIGAFCIAGVELVHAMRSPAVAAVVLFLSVLPFFTTFISHGTRWETPLPIRMQDTLPTVSRSSGTIVVSN